MSLHQRTTMKLGLLAVLLATAFSAKAVFAHHFQGHIGKRLSGDVGVTLEQKFNVSELLRNSGYKGPRPEKQSTRLVRIVSLKAHGKVVLDGDRSTRLEGVR